MNREIKFRAWDKINKQMVSHEHLPVLLKNVKDNNQWAYMQYTGLKDKKRTDEYPEGQEIYEGDIIAIESPDGTIEHGVGSVTWEYSAWQIRDGGMLDSFKNLAITVIGNIHENPELLEKP